MASRTIFVALVGEGTPTYRPVRALELNDGTFEITGTVPEHETWQFRPGTRVRCKARKLEDTELLFAHEAVAL